VAKIEAAGVPGEGIKTTEGTRERERRYTRFDWETVACLASASEGRLIYMIVVPTRRLFRQ
jgi:hypothetical protein